MFSSAHQNSVNTMTLADAINQLGPNCALSEAELSSWLKPIKKSSLTSLSSYDCKGRTPLMVAVTNANIQAVEWIFDEIDNESETQFYMLQKVCCKAKTAAKTKSTNKANLIAILFEERDKNGMTVLMHAADCSSSDEEKIPFQRRHKVINYILAEFAKLDLNRKLQQCINLIDILIKRNNVEFLETIFKTFRQDLKEKSPVECQRFMFEFASFCSQLFDKAFASNCNDIICSLLKFWRGYNSLLVFCSKPENADVVFKALAKDNLLLVKELVFDFPLESKQHGSAVSILLDKQKKSNPEDSNLYREIFSSMNPRAKENAVKLGLKLEPQIPKVECGLEEKLIHQRLVEVKKNPTRSFSHDFFKPELLKEKCKQQVLHKNLSNASCMME